MKKAGISDAFNSLEMKHNLHEMNFDISGIISSLLWRASYRNLRGLHEPNDRALGRSWGFRDTTLGVNAILSLLKSRDF